MESFIYIFIFVLPAVLVLRKDFQRGMCVALALFGFMPNGLILEGLGDGFEMTFQRVLLIVVVLFWVRYLAKNGFSVRVPHVGILAVWWLTQLLSLIFANDPSLSVKYFISYSTEIVLFYIIVSSTLTDVETVCNAFRAFCISTAIIAVLGCIEYYTLFNPFIDWFGVKQGREAGAIYVGFKHRILLGDSMAMGFPLVLAWTHGASGRLKRTIGTLGVMLTIACCYFTNSRGPWIGAVAAAVIMFFLGSRGVRRSLGFCAVLALVILVARPGVRATIWDLSDSTLDPDSYRGRSYAYRKELWPVGRKLVSKSTTRALFGYGGLATEKMDLYDMFQYGGNIVRTGFSSWDDNYAADLVEFGWVGLVVECVFIGAVLLDLGKRALRSVPENRDMAAAAFAAAAVYALAMTNVYIFSPQMKCVFFSLIVIGVRLSDLKAGEEESGSLHSDNLVGSAEPVMEEVG